MPDAFAGIIEGVAVHYFKRNIGDYHKKAGRLSMLEHGAYTLLLDACYDRERFPTLDEALEWSWARTDDEVAAVKFVLSKFFTLSEGVYLQQRVQDEIDAYHAKSLKNQEIALAREAARRAKRERNEHETCTNEHLTTNHKPLTTNQEDKSSCDQQAESPKSDRIDYGLVTSAFSEHLSALPQPRDMTEKRRKMVRSIVKRGGRYAEPDFFAKFFGYVTKSDFLMGRGAKPWHGCCFDWLLKPENFQKIIEGNYHGEGNNA